MRQKGDGIEGATEADLRPHDQPRNEHAQEHRRRRHSEHENRRVDKGQGVDVVENRLVVAKRDLRESLGRG